MGVMNALGELTGHCAGGGGAYGSARRICQCEQTGAQVFRICLRAAAETATTHQAGQQNYVFPLAYPSISNVFVSSVAC